MVLNEGLGMQQDGTIAWEPVVQPSTFKTWYAIVAVFLFVCVIYGVLWWARRRAENNPGSLQLRGDRPTRSDES
jgi:hypothetical protein